jgi:hypothetical protein
MEFSKIDETTLGETKPVKEETIHYDYDFLKSKEASIQADLEEVQNLIAQCESLGIKSKSEIEVKPIDTKSITINSK